MAAVDAVVEQVPLDAQEPLVAALRERFDEPMVLLDDASGSWQEGLRRGIRAQLGPLGDPGLTPSGHSFLEELDLDFGWLSGALSDAVVGAIRRVAVTGGALAPLATQLNFDQVRDDLAALRTDARTGGKPDPEARPVAECDPIGLGVHRAIRVPRQPSDVPSGDDLPKFVPRAHDGLLRAELDRGATDTKFIMLVGGSSTGKTRSAVEAIRDRLADWWLLRPRTAAGLIALIDGGWVRPRTVVWLDESQVYLEGGDGGEAAAAVRGLLGRVRSLVVVGTLWPEYWFAYMRPPEFGALDPHRQARQLLDTAIKIDVPDRFDEHELKLARRLATRDPRLAVALATQRDHGLTQVLAGGPALIDRLQNAPSPYGKAVITAAIDARRLGHFSAMSAGLLEAAAVAYLSGPQLASAPLTWFASALAYACEPVKGAIAPLTATSRTVGQVDGYLLADYLDQHGRTVRSANPVPDSVWAALIACTRLPGDLDRLGLQAASRARYRHARDLWSAALDHGDTSMAMSLWNLLARAGHSAQAGLALRQAAAAGDPEGLALLADLLRRDGQSGDLEQVLRQAAAAGRFEAAHDLAVLVHRAGRDDEAEQILKQAIAAGDRQAWNLLAVLLDRMGRAEAAEQVLRQAVAQGDETALRSLVNRLERTERSDDAERLLRSAASTGLFEAARELSFVLRRTGRTSEAEQILQEAGTRDTAALRMLADLLRHDGRQEEAEFVLRRAGAAGDTSALRELADMLRKAGREEDSDQALRRAGAEGNAAARDRLLPLTAPPRGRDAGTRRKAGSSEPHKVTFRPNDAIASRGGSEGTTAGPRRRIRIGSGDHRPAAIGKERHWSADPSAPGGRRGSETERVLRHGAAAGDADATHQLAVLLTQTGRSDEGERILRQSALAGDPHAIGLLARILQQTGRTSEASLLSRFGLAEDGSTAPAW